LRSFLSVCCGKSGMETKSHQESCERNCNKQQWKRNCTTCFGKTSGINGVKSMQRNASLQSTETNKVSFIKNKEEEDGLHILRVLQDLEDGILMKSRDSMSYVLLLQKIVKIIVDLILIISAQWKCSQVKPWILHSLHMISLRRNLLKFNIQKVIIIIHFWLMIM